MPKLLTGYVQNVPDFRYAGAKSTPILKFRVQVGDSWFKRQNVVVFGKHAEKHQDLEQGEFVTLSGELQENTFRDQTTMELVVGWKGNFKRHPDKPKKEMRSPTGGEDDEDYTPADGLAAAPRSYRGSADDEGQCVVWRADEGPDFEFPDPTDEEYAEFVYAYCSDHSYFPKWGFKEYDTNERDDD